MEEKRNISITIKEINEISLFLKPLPVSIEQVEFGKNLFLGLGFQFNIEPEKEIFKFKTLVEYSFIGFVEPIVSFETETVFHILNLKDVLKQEEEELKIKDDFLATIAGVCIGTTRGMLIAATKGTPIGKFPIPIVNPNELIQQMKSQNENSKENK